MKRIIFIILCSVVLGCVGKHPIMPTMDLPQEPQKPKIHWEVITWNNQPYIGLKMGEGLALWEYLIRLDVSGKEYRNRIETMNRLLVR